MRLKVLAVAHVPPPVHGAALVGEKVLRLVKENYNQSAVLEIKSSVSIEEIGVFCWRKVFGFLLLFCQIFVQLMFYRPKVVYYTASLSGFALVRDVMLVGVVKIFRINRVLLHLHTIGIDEKSGSKIYSFLYYLLFSGVEIITLSEFAKKDLRSVGVRVKKVHVLPNASPLEPSEPCCGKRGKVIKFLFLSNLMEEKGYKIALRLAKDLREQNRMLFEFSFAGSWGSEGDRVFFTSYIKENNLTGSVIYLGRLGGVEKENVLISHDVLVFPTYYSKESFPLVLLEAMAFGLAVVTTNHSAIPSIVHRDFSFLCETGEKIELAGLCEFLLNLDAAKIGAQEYYNRHYSDLSFTRNFFNILNGEVFE